MTTLTNKAKCCSSAIKETNSKTLAYESETPKSAIFKSQTLNRKSEHLKFGGVLPSATNINKLMMSNFF